MFTWGSNDFGELGRTKQKSTVAQPDKLNEHFVVTISAGPNSCVATTGECGTLFFMLVLAEDSKTEE